MYLTHEIIDSIRNAIGDKFGGQRLFAQKVGTSSANVSRWINGKNRRISNETWLKLQPHLAPFLCRDTAPQPTSRHSSPKDSGVTINVSGVSHSRIVQALKDVDYLSEDQKRDLIARIFYDNIRNGESAYGSPGTLMVPQPTD
ncbi:MAG: hypothetical protein IJJ28_07155 [Lentisphaeria bacterium]|nr:hypothetical protein [Lentisphaeria bacterium]